MIYLIDGIDRLGKSTLIKGIQDQLGYHLIIHYDKPVVLNTYKFYNVDGRMSDLPDKAALQIFQEQTNKNMFKLMSTNVPIIFDRTHLGEMVYAPLYRGYPGDYVFDNETAFLFRNPKLEDKVKLILLTTSNFDMLKDDGQSFNWDNKKKEQDLFVKAFDRSVLPKIKIDVHDGDGGYRNAYDILQEALK